MKFGAILRAATLAIPLLASTAHASTEAPGEPEQLPSPPAAKGPEDWHSINKLLDSRAIAAPQVALDPSAHQEVLRQAIKAPLGAVAAGEPQRPTARGTAGPAPGSAGNALGLQPRSTSGDVKFRVWGNGTTARAFARIPF